MYCTKCGNEMRDDAKFCPKCGEKNNGGKKTGKSVPANAGGQAKPAPVKTAPPKKAKAPATAEELNKKSKNLSLTSKILSIAIAVTVVVAGLTCTLVYCDVIKFPALNYCFIAAGLKKDSADSKKNDSDTSSKSDDDNSSNEDSTADGSPQDTDDSDYDTSVMDGEEYFKQNGEIKSSIVAYESKDVTNESTTYTMLSDLGLNQYAITYEYSLHGEYAEEQEISSSSSTAHPVYQTYYVCENGDTWVINVVNGQILALPLSYNLEHSSEVQIVLSEKDTIMSYDCVANKFYETIPKKTALRVIKVDKIDSATLELYTAEEIGKRV